MKRALYTIIVELSIPIANILLSRGLKVRHVATGGGDVIVANVCLNGLVDTKVLAKEDRLKYMEKRITIENSVCIKT